MFYSALEQFWDNFDKNVIICIMRSCRDGRSRSRRCVLCCTVNWACANDSHTFAATFWTCLSRRYTSTFPCTVELTLTVISTLMRSPVSNYRLIVLILALNWRFSTLIHTGFRYYLFFAEQHFTRLTCKCCLIPIEQKYHILLLNGFHT